MKILSGSPVTTFNLNFAAGAERDSLKEILKMAEFSKTPNSKRRDMYKKTTPTWKDTYRKVRTNNITILDQNYTIFPRAKMEQLEIDVPAEYENQLPGLLWPDS